MYSIGAPNCPEPSDPRFETLEAAVAAAVKASRDNGVWAVWEDESGEVKALVFAQFVYTP